MTISSKFSSYWANGFRQEEFPIGPYVKLSSAVAAILVGGLKCRTQIWKGSTQRSFQQSVVEIGSVVSDKNICLKFIPPFFLFLAWRPSWLKVRITGHNFGRGPSKDHSTKIWLQVVSEEKIKMWKFTTYDKWWQKKGQKDKQRSTKHYTEN